MWEKLKQALRKIRRSGAAPPAPPPLAGTPPVRRLKTYAGDSGYVYEYYYEGYRVSSRADAAGAEYVFTVSADRRNWFPVTVFLEDAAVAGWERRRGRELNMTERYAVVKMALFRAFDERETPAGMRRGVTVGPEAIGGLLETLGID